MHIISKPPYAIPFVLTPDMKCRDMVIRDESARYACACIWVNFQTERINFWSAENISTWPYIAHSLCSHWRARAHPSFGNDPFDLHAFGIHSRYALIRFLFAAPHSHLLLICVWRIFSITLLSISFRLRFFVLFKVLWRLHTYAIVSLQFNCIHEK